MLSDVQKEAMKEAYRLLLAWVNDPDFNKTFFDYYHILGIRTNPEVAERLIVGLVMASASNLIKLSHVRDISIQQLIEEELAEIDSLHE